jgi:hypothetical protein
MNDTQAAPSAVEPSSRPVDRPQRAAPSVSTRSVGAMTHCCQASSALIAIFGGSVGASP